MKSEAKRLEEIISVIRKHHLLKDHSPVNVREILEELGPTFIKLGQIMATRNDIIPKEYCDELKYLRSSVTPMDFETVSRILDTEYKGKLKAIFRSINKKPIGSASIAQVHKGVLKNGDKVVLKVQRENIYEMMTMDTKLMKSAIKILRLDKVFGDIVNLTSFVDEMYSTALEEMNFKIEALHIKEFGEKNKDVSYLKILKVYDDISTSKVLVMECIDGCPIDDKVTLKNEGYDLNEIALKLSDNYIKQAIDDGYYHADPHSDNIKILDGKIVYLDFGMMGRLTPRSKNLLERCMMAIIKEDTNEIAHVLVMLDTDKNKDDVDYMKLEDGIRIVLDQNKSTGIANVDIKEFINDMYSLLSTNKIGIPKDIVMLARGIVVLSGVLEDIAPSINLLEVLKNHFHVDDYFNKDAIQSFLLNSVRSGMNLIDMPKEALNTLKGINTGELHFNVEVDNSKAKNTIITNCVKLLIIALIDVGLIIGMGLLYTDASKPFLFYLYAVLFGILTIYLFYKVMFDEK